MSPGKLAAQVAHAAVLALDKASNERVAEWNNTGMTKIVLRVDNEAHLLDIYKQAVADYLPTSLICDEGRTEVTPGTFTCVGIGPAECSAIDSITGQLLLY